MSIALQAAVWAAPFASPAHKLFALALADEARDDGRFSYPDLSAYEARVGMTAADMAALLHTYVACGAVHVVKSTHPGGPAIHSSYRLRVDRLPEPVATTPPSIASLHRYRVLIEAQRLFLARFPRGAHVWRRRLRKIHSRFDADYTVELTRDLCLRVLDASTGREVVRSAPGHLARVSAAPAR